MKQHMSYRSYLLARLFAGIGLASTLGVAACTEGASGGSGGAGGSGDSGGSGGGSTTATGGSGGGSTTASGGSGGESTTATGGSGGGSTSTTTASSSSTMTAGQDDVERCFPLAAGATCPALESAAATLGACTPDNELVTAWLSGPTEVEGACCYQVDVSAPGDPACGIPGRPFVVEGQPRVAPVTIGSRGWEVQARASLPAPAPRSLRPDVAGLDAGARAAMGEQWARDAAYEHASVASFGKLALELLAFGAPSELVRAAHEAALDEVRHAELGFALASVYLGRPVGPAALPEAGLVTGAGSLAELATAALAEGCFGETVAAVLASAQLEAARDAAVRGVLAVIAEEEARHAELAFRVVAWAIATGGEPVRTAVYNAFMEALNTVRCPPSTRSWCPR
jgi:hypothetical protein